MGFLKSLSTPFSALFENIFVYLLGFKGSYFLTLQGYLGIQLIISHKEIGGPYEC
jgi:hypothetical protein